MRISIALVNMELNIKPTHFKGVLIKFVVFRDTLKIEGLMWVAHESRVCFLYGHEANKCRKTKITAPFEIMISAENIDL